MTADVSCTSSDKKDILLASYQVNADHLRHHDTQRSVITTLVVGIAGGMLAFGAREADPSLRSAYLHLVGTFIVGVGLFGAAAAMAHGVRIRVHQQRLDWLRGVMDEMFELPRRPEGIGGRLLAFANLTWAWVAFHLMITSLGGWMVWQF